VPVAFNARCVTRLRIIPFIVKLATLYFGRRFGLWLTKTRAMNLPESILRIGYQSDAAFSKAFKHHFGYAPLTAKRAQASS
jgi:ribose/xylose/arabinose/galactoside ABC-type transport system permease subunit